jgi:hypothetical protein
MPAPELEWQVYQVPAHLGGAAGPLEAAVPGRNSSGSRYRT